MRSGLRAPVREMLDDALPEGDVERLWTRIARGRTRSASRLVVWGTAFAVVASAVLVWILYEKPPAPLRLSDQREIPSVVAVASETVLSLDDGSVVSLAGGARLEVLESTGKDFSVALRHGRARFDVHPGGPRTWRVECGAITVEVVGTRFTVDRGEATISVNVERGAVLIRGEGVPDHVIRLSAGKGVTLATGVADREKAAVAPKAPAAGEAAVELVPRTASSAEAEVHGARPPNFSRERGADSVPSASPVRAASHEDSKAGGAEVPESLFQAADAARRQGKPDEAARLLVELLATYPADSRASLAELTLGRMYLDALDRPENSGEHLRRALRLGLPAALAEDAAARVVEAYAREGKPSLAAEAAAHYRSSYPTGVRTEYVDRWSPVSR